MIVLTDKEPTGETEPIEPGVIRQRLVTESAKIDITDLWLVSKTRYGFGLMNAQRGEPEPGDTVIYVKREQTPEGGKLVFCLSAA